MDNHDLTCSCHRRDYDPRCDGAWPDKLRAYLAASVGRMAYPAAHFGIADETRCVVRRSIAVLQRQGWRIVVTPGSGAYRVIAAPGTRDHAMVAGDSGEIPPTNGETP